MSLTVPAWHYSRHFAFSHCMDHVNWKWAMNKKLFWFAERRIIKTNISRWINILHRAASHSVKRSVKIPILWPIMLLERDLIHNISRVYQMIIGYTHKLCGYYTNSNGEAAALLRCCKTRSPALLRTEKVLWWKYRATLSKNCHQHKAVCSHFTSSNSCIFYESSKTTQF